MDFSVNMAAVLLATVAQFVVGSVWYMPLFGRLWGKIHDFEQYDAQTQAAMQKQMLPLLALQLVLGFLTAYILAHFMTFVADREVYELAFWAWLGFIVPTQISAVIFGGTKPRWIVAKVMVMAGGSLASIMAAAWILHIMG